MSNKHSFPNESSRPEDAHSQADFSNDEWMTIEQVAEHFGCPASRVREWIADGVLTTRVSGSIELIQRSQLDQIENSSDPVSDESGKQYRGPSL